MELIPIGLRGPQRPSSSVPARRPGSVRRTSVVDMVGASGDEPITLRGSARDLHTGPDLRPRVVGTGQFEMRVERSAPPRIGHGWVRGWTPERVRHASDGLAGLVGTPATVGYRTKLALAFPDERERATPLHTALDDVPGGTIISRYPFAVPGAGGSWNRPDPPVDVCSGWASDATMMRERRRTGRLPTVSGPAAPDLDDLGDPWAWHVAEELAPGDVRRRRRLDVVAVGDGLEVDAMFRDTFRHADGTETVIHEYGLRACVERGTGRVVEVAPEARVLPWPECPAAVASAQRLVGEQVGALRDHVRSTFTGTTSCTHLNDLLRSLEDVVALARHLEQDGPE